MARLRSVDLYKLPGVGETLTWARALAAVGDLDASLGAALKVREDIDRVRAEGCWPVPERFVSLLAAGMRAGGARVGVGEVLSAHRALAVVGPAAARSALAVVLCSSRRDLAAFDAAWAALVDGGEAAGGGALDELLRTAEMALPRVGVPLAEEAGPAAAPPDAGPPAAAAWSAEELLLDKDFALYTDAERRLARALVWRIARRAPRRRSRRTRASGRRGDVHDLRATMRASLRYGGEPVERRWRAPAPRPRPLVLVVDVSGRWPPTRGCCSSTCRRRWRPGGGSRRSPSGPG